MSDNEQEYLSDVGGSDSDNESVVSDNDSVASEIEEPEPEADIPIDNDSDIEGGANKVMSDSDDNASEIEDDENYDSDDGQSENENETPAAFIGGGKKKTSTQNFTSEQSGGADSDDEEDDEDDAYLQKFNEQINKNYIVDNHPECVNVNFDEVVAMSKIVRDTKNNIIDDLHRTLPYLTKYEKARILGQRARQINSGMSAFIKVPENVIDGYLIAEMELAQKRIPFIIKRPIPGGGCEYWKISDLELVCF
jgi:DNA-directed RNA polymerase I, II, and III subunit RPABC2